MGNTGDPFEHPPTDEGNEVERGPGSLLGEHYEVLEERRGGMGVVYICRIRRRQDDDPETDTRVALKSFQRRLFFDSSSRIAFLTEAKLWTQLSDVPHVMPVLGIEEIDGQPFLRMLAVPPGPQGELNLHDYLRSGPLDPASALRAAMEVSLAMDLANGAVAGVVHGDLKPHNLLVIRQSVFVADFGLARAGNMAAGALALEGTWAYQAPETFAEREFTQRSDIYAFGATILELLSGKPCFAAETRGEWADAHARRIPEAPDFEDEPGTSLAELALQCLAKDPDERPPSFGAIRECLHEIAEEWDPVQELMWLMDSSRLKQAFTGMGPEAAFQRASGLLRIGENQAALEVLEAVPEDDLDGETLVLKGTALSLADRDEEALEVFEAALAGELSNHQRQRAQCELALSLKRLGRFAEAIELFRALMYEVQDDLLPNVVINLGTVYMDSGQLAEAERLFVRFLRTHSDQPIALINLGRTRELLDRPTEALEDYDRALSFDSGRGEAHVRRAAVLMDSLNRVLEAWIALDMAFDQGFQSREWFVRMLACADLLERGQQAQAMVVGARRNLGTELTDSMIAEAERMVARIRAGEPPEHPIQESLPDTEAGGVGEPERRESGTSESGFSMPFLNFRLYGSTRQFTIDFYADVDSATYAERFRESWFQASREDLGGAEMRTTRIYFTQCPGCGLKILTNRDRGKELRCRRCSTVHACAALDDPSLVELIDELHDVVGLKLVGLQGVILVVVFQCKSAEQEKAVEEACRQAGFEETPPRHAVVGQTAFEGVKRGIFESADSVRGWQKPAGSSELGYEGQTPPEVEALVRVVREREGGVTSMSTSYDLDGYDPITAASLTGDLATAQRLLERELLESPNDPPTMALLVEMLCAQELHEDALPYAQGVTELTPEDARAWMSLGRIEAQLGWHADAVKSLERALALDPTSAGAMFMLGHVHAQLGDIDRAQAWIARSQALGGPLP